MTGSKTVTVACTAATAVTVGCTGWTAGVAEGVSAGAVVGVDVAVGVDVTVAVAVGVSVAVGVFVDVGVAVAVGVGVDVAVAVDVGVGVAVMVDVGVDVAVAVLVGVGVEVAVAVDVGVGVAVTVDVGVFVAVGVDVAVTVLVGEGVAVMVDVCVGVVVDVAVGVELGVGVAVAVPVAVGVELGVDVAVTVGVAVGVALGVAVGVAVPVGVAWESKLAGLGPANRSISPSVAAGAGARREAAAGPTVASRPSIRSTSRTAAGYLCLACISSSCRRAELVPCLRLRSLGAPAHEHVPVEGEVEPGFFRQEACQRADTPPPGPGAPPPASGCLAHRLSRPAHSHAAAKDAEGPPLAEARKPHRHPTTGRLTTLRVTSSMYECTPAPHEQVPRPRMRRTFVSSRPDDLQSSGWRRDGQHFRGNERATGARTHRGGACPVHARAGRGACTPARAGVDQRSGPLQPGAERPPQGGPGPRARAAGRRYRHGPPSGRGWAHHQAVRSAGLEEEVEQRVEIPAEHSVAGRVVARGEPVVVDDVATADVASPLLRERTSASSQPPNAWTP